MCKHLYPQAKKIKNPEDYPDSIKNVYDVRLKRLEDSTKDVTITYGVKAPSAIRKQKKVN